MQSLNLHPCHREPQPHPTKPGFWSEAIRSPYGASPTYRGIYSTREMAVRGIRCTEPVSYDPVVAALNDPFSAVRDAFPQIGRAHV